MTSKKTSTATTTARRVSVASLGAPRGPVKFSVGTIRRFVALKPAEAQVAIMRRGLPGRPKAEERRHREEMVAFVAHIQKSPARKRAWLAKSAPGRTADTGTTLAKVLARQTPKEIAAAMPKGRTKKKASKAAKPRKVAKKAIAAKPAKTQQKPSRAVKTAPASKTPTVASKKAATKSKGLLKKASTTLGRAKKAAKKVAKRARTAAQASVKRTINRIDRRTKAGRQMLEDKKKVLEQAQQVVEEALENPGKAIVGDTYPDTGEHLDDKDRRDIAAGLPIWTGPKSEPAEQVEEEASVAS